MPADLKECIAVFKYLASVRPRGARAVEIKTSVDIPKSVIDTILFCETNHGGKIEKTKVRNKVFYHLTDKGDKYLKDPHFIGGSYDGI